MCKLNLQILNIKDTPSIINWLLTGLVFIFCFHSNNLKAQIGSIGGFNSISLSQKNDLVLSFGKIFEPGSLSFSELNAYETQVAYAFNRHLAVQAGYHTFYRSHRDVSDLCETNNCKNYLEDQLFNISFGGFFSYNLKKSLFLQNKKRNYKYVNKAQLLFDAYLSYGKSINVTNHSQGFLSPGTLYPSSTLKFDSYHIQTNISYNGNFSGLSFSVMSGIIDFNKISNFGNVPFSLENLISVLSIKTIFPFYGYQFKIWAGIGQFKLVYSKSRKTILDEKYSNQKISNYLYSTENLNQLALQFNLDFLSKKKKLGMRRK